MRFGLLKVGYSRSVTMPIKALQALKALASKGVKKVGEPE